MSPRRLLCSGLCITIMLLATTRCSKSPTDDDADSDKTPPDVINDLVVITSTSHTATLQWTAPHDYRDDGSNGMIDEYDLRVSYDSITPVNFAQAHRLDSVATPAPAGAAQQCVIDVLEPDSLYFFAVKSRDDKGNWSAISNCCRVHCPPIAVVTFADSVLERIIRVHLSKPSGDVLSTDVDTITIIAGAYQGITSLSGLEYFVSLQGAELTGNNIVDIAPLSGATQLWGLNIGQNHISDLSPLAGLPGLRQLSIAENPITDISALASTLALQQLFMFGTQVTDFSPLYGLVHLDDIHLAALSLTDISFMSNLTHLRICKLNSNSITSIAPLGNLTALEGLDLMMNQISDLGPLTGLVNLHDVNLTYNSITDIQPLVDNTGLGAGDVVYLGENALSQQAIDVEIPTLQGRGVTVTW
ncbi:MAG: leucine-rich repeat domain-containing protein [candidate division Zixibacteria bacterium]|nr:leucine-rich repeat domain-containing protein [candidate division Zixibacteria bacterium]